MNRVFKKLNQREQILIIVLIILVLAFLYYYFAYQPLRNSINDLQREINIRERELMTTKVLVRRLPQLEDKYNSMKGLERKIELINLNVEDFFTMLDQLTGKYNIAFTSYTPKLSENMVNITITIRATYNNLIDFLYSLQIFRDQVLFKEIQINRGQEEDLNIKIQLSYQLVNGGDRD